MSLYSPIFWESFNTFDETFYFQLLEIPTAAARAEAKKEILALFSEEPDDEHEWTEQDIYEQARKIIQKYC